MRKNGMMRGLRAGTLTLFTLGFGGLVGCGAAEPDAPSTEPSAVIGQAPIASPAGSESRAPATALLRQIEGYTQALIDRDAGSAAKYLSRGRLQRIQKKYAASDTARFMEVDRANLLQTIGEVDSVRGRFALLRLEPTEDGAIAYLGFDRLELPKPLRLVLEDGVYKVDGGPITTLAGATYRLKNFSPSSKTVACIYDHSTGISGWGAETYMFCDDEWDVCSDSGTQFTYKGSNFYCDYNTWGVDFFINPDGSGQCNDHCATY